MIILHMKHSIPGSMSDGISDGTEQLCELVGGEVAKRLPMTPD